MYILTVCCFLLMGSPRGAPCNALSHLDCGSSGQAPGFGLVFCFRVGGSRRGALGSAMSHPVGGVITTGLRPWSGTPVSESGSVGAVRREPVIPPGWWSRYVGPGALVCRQWQSALSARIHDFPLGEWSSRSGHGARA
jgi:hypothetical protein